MTMQFKCDSLLTLLIQKGGVSRWTGVWDWNSGMDYGLQYEYGLTSLSQDLLPLCLGHEKGPFDVQKNPTN